MPDLNICTNDPAVKFGEVCLFNGLEAKEIEAIIERYPKTDKGYYTTIPAEGLSEIEKASGIKQVVGFFYD